MKENVVYVVLLIAKPLFFILLVMIGLMKDCCDDTDPLDRGDSMAKYGIGISFQCQRFDRLWF